MAMNDTHRKDDRHVKTKIKIVIATLLATLSAGFSNAGQPPPVSYLVTVQMGHIVVTDAKNGAYMGGATFEKFGVPTASAQDKLRHVALDTVAAVVAGNGSREHSVNPNSPVYTLADYEAKKAPYMTATFEHGFTFFILSDIRGVGHYEAKIGVIKSGQFRPAPPRKSAVEPEATG
jgi:hypothetical protein